MLMSEIQIPTFSFNNQAVIDEFHRKHKRLTTLAKWVVAIGILALIAPAVALAIKGAIGVMVAGVLGLVIIYATPPLINRFANYKLRALKAEAERNPIETLENQQIKKEQELQKEANGITENDLAVEDYRSSLRKEAELFPENVQAALPNLHALEDRLARRREKYAAARVALELRRHAVSRASSRYRVAMAEQRANAVAGTSSGIVLDKILEDIAFGAVESATNRSMAELRTENMVDQATQAAMPKPHADASAMLNAPKIDVEDLMRQLSPRTTSPEAISIERNA